jgi:hypothetical protein
MRCMISTSQMSKNLALNASVDPKPLSRVVVDRATDLRRRR